jgi:hypothetical protein
MYLTHNNVFYFGAANQSLGSYELDKAISHRRQIYPTCVTILLAVHVFQCHQKVLHFEWK